MSHNLEIVEGKVQHVYVGDEPWHGLGKRVLPDLTPAQMMKEAGIDWAVKKSSTFAEHNKKRVKLPGKALIRVSDDPAKDGTFLTMVGPKWNPVQNQEFVEFFHDFVMNGDMDMHTAGSLREGTIVWMQAKIRNGAFEVFKGDVVESYMLFSNFHIYGKKTDIRQTGTRVVCNNTLDMALYSGSGNSIQVDHRRKFDAELVKQAMLINADSLKAYEQAAKFVGSRRAKTENVMDYFRALEPATTEKKKESGELGAIASMFVDALEKQPGAEFGAGTWWQAFNATTYAYDHMVGQDRGSEEATRDNRLNKAWYGDTRKKKAQALSLAVEFANAA